MLKVDEYGTRQLPDHLRIKYWSSEYAADADRNTFKKYMKGEYTITQAVAKIAAVNKVKVSVQQFLANAEWLGYVRWPH